MDHQSTIEEFFQPGRVFYELTEYGCTLLCKVFPKIAERYRKCSAKMKHRYGFSAPFGGLFFNFCVNGIMAGHPRVKCLPHIDFKNLALGVCMIYVYGHFDHKEKCWIVIWEAGIALELPPGVFLIYPSSLFLHFNVDLDGKQIHDI